MKNFLYFFYILAALIFIVAHYSNYQLVCDLSKPIPLLILIGLIKWNSPYKRFISLGLILSLVGDIILESFKLFVPGLIAFLVAHVFYILAFLRKSSNPKPLSSIPFYAYGILLFLFLYGSLGELVLPVLVYMFIICTMLWRSFIQQKVDKLSAYAFYGALIFTISDSLIAISKFYQDFYLAPLLVMLTYWVGQFLIYKSTREN